MNHKIIVFHIHFYSFIFIYFHNNNVSFLRHLRFPKPKHRSKQTNKHIYTNNILLNLMLVATFVHRPHKDYMEIDQEIYRIDANIDITLPLYMDGVNICNCFVFYFTLKGKIMKSCAV